MVQQLLNPAPRATSVAATDALLSVWQPDLAEVTVSHVLLRRLRLRPRFQFVLRAKLSTCIYLSRVSPVPLVCTVLEIKTPTLASLERTLGLVRPFVRLVPWGRIQTLLAQRSARTVRLERTATTVSTAINVQQELSSSILDNPRALRVLRLTHQTHIVREMQTSFQQLALLQDTLSLTTILDRELGACLAIPALSPHRI